MTLPDDVDVSELEPGPHEDEPHEGGLNNRLNWLRAGVLGANDGIVSTAGIVMGVAGATSDRGAILVAGVAGLAAGALSMAAGEYVSVSTQKDSELALEVAKQLTEHDALGAHAETELGIDPDDITSPWNAALASMLSFTLGALLPLLTITLFGPTLRIWVTVVSVTVALVLTGWGSAKFGYGPSGRAVVRNVVGGLFAMAVTYAIGSALGAHV